MPKQSPPLSDMQVKRLKPREKDYKVSDGGGLFLLVKSTGGKLWRLAYRFNGKQKTLALGTYPERSLADARADRDDARRLLANGADPSEVKQSVKEAEAARQELTFEKLAMEWYAQRAEALAPTTLEKIMTHYLQKNVFPVIGDTPVADLTTKIILENVLRPIEARGVIQTAHRVRSYLSQIFRYGVACQYIDRDLTADLKGAIKPTQTAHRAAITDPVKVGALLRAIDDFDGHFVVKCALRLHPLVVTRPGELRHAEWLEIDFDAALWSIPAGKMKTRNPHIVPLSSDALAILRELHQLTGGGRYLFPSVRSTDRPISDNTLNAALRRMGYATDEMTAHGWRAVFRTLADEVLQERVDIIEAQLAHQVQDTLGRAYNRTSFMQERRALMEKWARYLRGLKTPAQVIPLRRKGGKA
ncbi:tyrosine-type recombinase/integrase [Trichloromonas sp.]|uniref:tyrosine-type recombinase/integrase n=1 Tax=Trichloromonas sp. TaxID=3069249 RepID=UPI002A452016|nr:integrase arm-type DNA-binding domain-containing protein [Trichloromonas sp.]